MTPEFMEAGKFSGRIAGKLPEKSNFSMTCNLLSQYLREKGNFRDLNLGMACNQDGRGKSDATFSRPTTTMNLLTEIEASGRASPRSDDSVLPNVKSMDLFPQHAGFDRSIANEKAETINPESSDLRPGKTEPATAQMTIFYGGKIVVFDEFPADKAQAIMQLASNGETFKNNNPSSAVSSTANNSNPNALKSIPEAKSSDLPIARKASLHRFLEKRKDRITARAPYKVNGSTGSPAEQNIGFSMEKRPAMPESCMTPSSLGLTTATTNSKSTSFPWASRQLNPFALQLQPFSS